MGEVEKFQLRWEQLKPRETSLQDGGPEILNKSLTVLREKRQEWDMLLQTREKLLQDCGQFGIETAEFSAVEEMESDLKKHEDMWSLYDEFNTGVQNMSNEEWIVFRSKSYKFEEFLQKWEERLKSGTETTSLTVRLLQEIEKFKVILPQLKYVRGEMFSDKHWLEMFGILGIPSKSVEMLTFADFLNVKEKIASNATALQDLNARAASEIVIRQALGELDIWEVEAKFILTEHSDSQGQTVMLIKDFKDILNKVGDNQCLLQSVKNSPNYDSFIDRASIWETRLADLDEYLRNLNQIQRKWVYLEPIFGAGTLSQDQARFQRVDQDFRYIMGDVARDNKVVSLCRISNLHQILNTLLDQLSRCQKSLNDFLEEKRSIFPRFYFLGDDDLLEILGQSTKETVIQAHLKKLFAGIHSVTFDDDGQHIMAMKSLEGEVVHLNKHVKLTQQVEEWLSNLASEMKATLKQLLLDCLNDIRRSNSGADPLKYPSQILCLAESIIFTERCESSIHSEGLESLLTLLKAQLDAYTKLELEWADSDTDGDSLELELKLKALLLDTIHHMSIVEQLIEGGVSSAQDWHWQRQLRFYTRNDGVAIARMVDAEFEYTYEYQGNAPKLVHTPLTDKCYLTLTQGMNMGLGGNPYGPAGTGKTESVKALGGLLGRQVLVFNCDEGIDVKSMARIFVGLVKCGAWGCFDEFNRLEEATLSAISMQIQPIQSALKNGYSNVKLLDDEIPLDPNSGIFVTLNPAGKGYGGRQKLPDNLKQLFRPVVMSRPDNDLIAEVILYCEGFRYAKSIGKKLVEVFDLSRKLLTKQQHYDWGLRALKTVLGGCGSVLKAARKNLLKEEKGSVTALEEEGEMELVVQALRLNTLSKLTFADCTRFDSLVQDVFPGIPFTSSGYQDLTAALKESFTELGLLYNDDQSLIKMGKSLKQHTINPKAMPRTQLLGQIDLDTRQWTDGVLTLSALQVYSEPPDVHSWIVCDGDVDPEWIESLNSVLDDNRLLTLPSGWRIQFGVNWVIQQGEMVVTTSLVGVIQNGLSQLHEVTSRANFTVALIRGLGGNLTLPSREAFAKQVFEWTGEYVPDQSRMLYYYHNPQRDGLDMYTMDNENIEQLGTSVSSLPIIKTADVKRTLDIIEPWLNIETQQPFLLVGPQGCGKSMLLRHSFSKLRSTEVATIHCSAQITPQHVLQKLSQVITYHGFYDNNLEWVGLERVQIVGSITGGNAMGRHSLSPRFTSIVRIYSIRGEKDRTLRMEFKVKSTFTPVQQNHYLFTPRDLTRWCFGLLRYDLKDDDQSTKLVLEVLVYEAMRLFRDKLVSEEDMTQFDSIISDVLESDWSRESLLEKLSDVYYVSEGAQTVTAVGVPLPPFGKPLGKMNATDWSSMVERGIVVFGMCSLILNIHFYKFCTEK
ncbi:Cytoplasmic dynein 2 heavy chain 1 [Blattella germanica]|nr:Cytoplasmic dynein 2 heavy chain 1 [Blattella germanica]